MYHNYLTWQHHDICIKYVRFYKSILIIKSDNPITIKSVDQNNSYILGDQFVSSKYAKQLTYFILENRYHITFQPNDY